MEKLEERNTQTFKNCMSMSGMILFSPLYFCSYLQRSVVALRFKKILFCELDIRRSCPDSHKLSFLILSPGNSVDNWNVLRAKLFVKFTLKNIRGNPEFKSLKEKSFAHSGLV